jgi:propanol-preferring alcohol dehydrogenase
MKAMILQAAGEKLVPVERPDPEPGPGQVRVTITACGVCRTDLHVLDGELPHIKYPIIPGHEIVGRVEALGEGVTSLKIGQRVGIPWLGHACGHCPYCLAGRENLCDTPLFTGYTRDGGFATKTVADAHFVFPLGEDGEDAALAPLLCAGLIGWRSLKMAGEGKKLGLYGFGAAAHIIAQVAKKQGRDVFAFTSPGDQKTQDFARLGRGLGRGLGPEPAGSAGRGHHLCAGGKPGAQGAESGEERRTRGVRRDPHVGHPGFSL